MPLDDGGSTSVEWAISDADRAAFAELSGDHNPIHTDPVAARRLIGGRMIVHGAHLLLTALDQAVERGHLAAVPATIDARFLHGVVPDRPLVTTIDAPDDVVRITIAYDVWIAAEIVVSSRGVASLGPSLADDLPLRPAVPEPDDVPFDRLGEVSGTIALDDRDDHADCRRLFPAACEAFGAGFVAEVAALSCVIGMHAPGRHSLSSRYRISSGDRGADTGTLRFGVVRVHRRTRRVDVAVVADHLAATLEAFNPEGPVDQRQQLTDTATPNPQEFAARRTLIIGGSRGLGAAAAQLLRAGGADVRATGRHTSAWRFDAHDGTAGLDTLVADGWHPTSVCWFATPPYGDGTPRAHSDRHAAELVAVQVDAFVGAIDHLRHVAPSLEAVLWPSAGTGTSELLAAKLAGEAAADELRQRHTGLTVLAPRLPTMLTDQTRSLLPIEYADTAATLLGVLRELPG